MREIVARRWGIAVATIVGWRALSELLLRRRELRIGGVLDARIAERRDLRVRSALERAGLARAYERARSPVYAAVDVGRVRAGDLDDVGLLEGAMRRAPRDRMDGVVVRMPDPETDWAVLLEPSTPEPAAPAPPVVLGARLLVLVGAALTLVPLVRPLSDGAPWLALGGLAFVVAGLLLARRAA
jgi:hypothetical protein